MLKTPLLRLSLILICSFTALSLQAQQPALSGVWRGTFNINVGGDREFIVTITEEADGLKAMLDIPSQSILGITVETFAIDGNNIRLLIPRIGGEYYGTIHSNLGTDGRPVRIDGDWGHAGEYIPITLLRSVAD